MRTHTHTVSSCISVKLNPNFKIRKLCKYLYINHLYRFCFLQLGNSQKFRSQNKFPYHLGVLHVPLLVCLIHFDYCCFKAVVLKLWVEEKSEGDANCKTKKQTKKHYRQGIIWVLCVFYCSSNRLCIN